MVPFQNQLNPIGRIVAPRAITVAAGTTTTSLADTSFGILVAGEDPANSELLIVGGRLFNATDPALDTNLTYGGSDGARYPLPAGVEHVLPGPQRLNDVYVANDGTDDVTLYVLLYCQAPIS